MRIPRSRGAVSGVLLVILGAWGALAPLIGPYFDFTVGSDSTWNLTDDIFWLSLLPGAVAVIGGLILLRSANRATAGLGAWLGIAAGAWFVVGDELIGPDVIGAGTFEHLTAVDGLGVAMSALAAFALGRLAVRSVRDDELAREAARVDHDGDGRADTAESARETGRFERDPDPLPAGTATHRSEARTDTLTAADRVREAADHRGERRGFFRRS